MLKVKLECNFNGVQALNFIHGFRRLLLYSTKANPSSSLANYLVETLGFSSQQSLFTSNRFSQRRNSSRTKNVSDDYGKLVSNANLVINFFKQNGFDDSNIRKIIRNEPRILVSKVDKTLKPKIELLQSIGLSGSDLFKAVSVHPAIFLKRLNPVIEALRQVVGSDENVCKVLLKCHYHARLKIIINHMIPNVELLGKYGITNDVIQKLIVHDPMIFFVRTQLFKDRLIRVEQKLGISRDSGMFLYGFRLVSHFSEKTVQSKLQVFESFGWVQSDILELTRKLPNCLNISAAMIKKKLGFLISELGYRPAYLLSNCALLTCSFENRVVPRYKVLLVLKEKGLIKMNYTLRFAVKLKESQFVNKFVLPYEEVHEIYSKHVGFSAKLLTQGRKKDHSKL